MEQKLLGTENIEGRCELGDRYYGRLKRTQKTWLKMAADPKIVWILV